MKSISGEMKLKNGKMKKNQAINEIHLSRDETQKRKNEKNQAINEIHLWRDETRSRADKNKKTGKIRKISGEKGFLSNTCL
ncbi:MAG: hypothetical protein LBR10_07945 [Prevotellaceae bacterium]|jgi:hypothetical protein|nr:hypothetical protein [Prevotellaceae bacterium]